MVWRLHIIITIQGCLFYVISTCILILCGIEIISHFPRMAFIIYGDHQRYIDETCNIGLPSHGDVCVHQPW
jgi:hypothetical protein